MKIESTVARRPGRKKSGQKRLDIQRAASNLFLANGLDATTMDAVAAAAGVSKQTVYSHFKGKEELFQSCIAKKVALHSLDEDALPSDRPYAEALTIMGERFMELLGDPEVTNMHRAVIAQSTAHPEIARLFYEAGPQRAIRAIARLLEEHTRKGTVSIDDTEVAAELFLSMVKGISDMRCMVNVAPPMSEKEMKLRAKRAVAWFLLVYPTKL